MATTSQDIYALIERLTTAEKSYFRKEELSADTKAAKQMLVLWEELDRLLKKRKEGEAIDEESLQLRTTRRIGKHNFPKLKHQLYDSLLSSLRAYQYANSPLETYIEAYRKARILSEKGLYKEAKQLLVRHRKRLDEEGLYPLGYLYSQHWQMLAHMTNHREEVEEAILNQFDAAERMYVLMRYNVLYDRVYGLQRKQGLVREENYRKQLQAILNEAESIDIPIKDDKTKATRLMLMHDLHFSLENLHETLQFSIELVNMLLESKELKGSRLSALLGATYNLLNDALRASDLEAYQKHLPILEGFETKTAQEQWQKENLLLTLLLDYACMFDEVSSAAELSEKLDKRLTKSEQMPPYRQMQLVFQMIELCFRRRDYDRCLSWISRFYAEHQAAERIDQLLVTAFIELIVHYEKGHYDVLEHYIRSVYNRFGKKKVLTPAEEQLYRLIKKLQRAKGKAEVQAVFASSTEALAEDVRHTSIHYPIYQWLKQNSGATN